VEMITTTLNKIRENKPCQGGWEKLLRHLNKTKPDDAPLPLITILESNGLDNALWCLRAVEGHEREMRLYAVACARRVQHLMTDPRSINAVDVAERYANGDATDKELEAARAAARAAANAATRAATWAAADSAWDAAWAAADATRAATRAAAWAAAYAARAAAGKFSERNWQEDEFKRRFG
jgi:hypothetical protein